MYLSIGNDMAVRDSSIIGIFDMDNTSTSKRTRVTLEEAEKQGQVVPCDDLPKSFILTAEYGFSRIYLTALSTQTLENNMENRVLCQSGRERDFPINQTENQLT